MQQQQQQQSSPSGQRSQGAHGPKGWQTMGGLLTSKQMAAAAAASGSTGGGGGGGGVSGVLTGASRGAAAAAAAVLGGAAAAAAVAGGVGAIGTMGPGGGGAGGGAGLRLGYTVMSAAADDPRTLFAGELDPVQGLHSAQRIGVPKWCRAPTGQQGPCASMRLVSPCVPVPCQACLVSCFVHPCTTPYKTPPTVKRRNIQCRALTQPCPSVRTTTYGLLRRWLCPALPLGTADARLCSVDLERCRVVSEWLAAPAVRIDADDAVSAMCTLGGGGSGSGADGQWADGAVGGGSPEVVAAGLRSGRVMLLDRRCGVAAAAVRAHSGDVSCMASYGSHVLVTAGGDKQLRVWDLRRAGGGAGGSASSSFSAAGSGAGGGHGSGLYDGYDSRTGPWYGWDGSLPGGGVCGDALLGIVDAMSPLGVGAILYGNGTAVVRALDNSGTGTGGGGGPGPGITPAPPQPALLRGFSLPREGVMGLTVLRDCVLMTSGSSVGVLPLSLSAGGGWEGSGPSFARLRNGRGGREVAAITSLAVLPCCRLLVVAGDDGAVRICM